MRKQPTMNTAALTHLAAVTLLALGLAWPAQAEPAPKIVKKIPMEFPDEAVRRGIDKGVLKTRITIDAAGAVTEVSVIDTQPPRAKMLNVSVMDSLRGWRFEGSGKTLTFDLQVVLTSE